MKYEEFIIYKLILLFLKVKHKKTALFIHISCNTSKMFKRSEIIIKQYKMKRKHND